jgi:phosphoserine phosphatase RsbU/P
LDIGKGRPVILGGTQSYLKKLSDHLENSGFAPALWTEGPWTAERLRSESPDILLIDLQTPGLDAPRLLGQFCADDALREMPVIVLATSENLPTVESCLVAGAEDYILAPFSPSLVLAQVRDYVRIARRRQDARSKAKQDELQKIEHDLQVARTIQAGFLPTELPQPDGWEIAARFEPAREVAGDFYDAFTLSQNRRLGLVIADVVDKGVPAALFMALVRSLTRAFAQQNYSMSWAGLLEGDAPPSGGVRSKRAGRSIPSTGTIALKNAVQLTNNYITNTHGSMNMFATMFFGMLDPANGQLAYINAGHNPPFLLGPDGAVKAALKGTGPAVGMFPDVDFRIEFAQLDPGDTLYTYTDGVTEARNVSKGFYTEKRLCAVLGHPIESAAGLLDRVQDSLREFMTGAAQFDDITMMAVRYAAKTAI